MDKRCFTLIELLIIIAIISILTSMLLPALNKARSQVKTISCANNLKQLGQAFNIYTQENDGWGPDHPQTGNISGFTQNDRATGMQWDIALASYLNYDYFSRSGEVYHCPESKYPLLLTDKWKGRSYSRNSFLGKPGINNPFYKDIRKINRVLFPSIIFNLADYYVFYDGVYDGDHIVGGDRSNGYYKSYFDIKSYRHNKMSNVLFLDAHVSRHPKGYVRDGEYFIDGAGLSEWKDTSIEGPIEYYY